MSLRNTTVLESSPCVKEEAKAKVIKVEKKKKQGKFSKPNWARAPLVWSSVLPLSVFGVLPQVSGTCKFQKLIYCNDLKPEPGIQLRNVIHPFMHMCWYTCALGRGSSD